MSKYLDETGLGILQNILKTKFDSKVDKVSGKGLSTNDYTTTEKNKLSGIESGANKTTVYTASECTTYTTDSGACTPAAVKQAVSKFQTDTTYNTVTTSTAGLMSAADKTKLDGITSGANKYTLPTASTSTLGGVKVGSNLSISNGVLSATNTTYSAATQSTQGLMTADDKKKLDGIAAGATAVTSSTVSGWGFKTTDNNTWKANSSSSEGYVSSGANQANKVWKTDANGNPAWRDDANTTYSAATQSAQGLMSAADKTKLDGVATGANNYSLPTASSSTLGGIKVGTNLSISSGVLSAKDTTYSDVTTSTHGLMTATDKTKLDGIATGANKTTINNTLTSTSTSEALSANQGKVLNDKIGGLYVKHDNMTPKYVLVADSYSVKTYTGDGNTDPVSKIGVTFSQKYTVGGTCCADGSQTSGVNAMTADSEVSDVVVLTGVNDCQWMMNDKYENGKLIAKRKTAAEIKSAVGTFLNACYSKFPNAKVHLYFCGNNQQQDQVNLGTYRWAKYEVFNAYKSYTSNKFEIVDGSWSLIISSADTSDGLHPNQAAVNKFYPMIGQSIKNNFAPINRHEIKSITDCGTITPIQNTKTVNLQGNAGFSIDGANAQFTCQELFANFNGKNQQSVYTETIGICRIASPLFTTHGYTSSGLTPPYTSVFFGTCVGFFNLMNGAGETTMITAPCTLFLSGENGKEIYVQHVIPVELTNGYPYIESVMLKNVDIKGDIFSVVA